jgi:hypothetical protein
VIGVNLRPILGVFAGLLPDDRGGLLRAKMGVLGAFGWECKGIAAAEPMHVKRRAANIRKPASNVKQMSNVCPISFFPLQGGGIL